MNERADRSGTLRSRLARAAGTWAGCLVLAVPPVALTVTDPGPGPGNTVVYRSVDADGVVSFSDTPAEGAEEILLPVAGAREGAVEAQQQRIVQQLEVAKALEESRLARQAARTERLQALAKLRESKPVQQEPVRERYVRVWPYGIHRPWHPPHHPGKPSLPVEPAPEPVPPSRPVPLPPLN